MLPVSSIGKPHGTNPVSGLDFDLTFRPLPTSLVAPRGHYPLYLRRHPSTTSRTPRTETKSHPIEQPSRDELRNDVISPVDAVSETSVPPGGRPAFESICFDLDRASIPGRRSGNRILAYTHVTGKKRIDLLEHDCGRTIAENTLEIGPRLDPNGLLRPGHAVEV